MECGDSTDCLRRSDSRCGLQAAPRLAIFVHWLSIPNCETHLNEAINCNILKTNYLLSVTVKISAKAIRLRQKSLHKFILSGCYWMRSEGNFRTNDSANLKKRFPGSSSEPWSWISQGDGDSFGSKRCFYVQLNYCSLIAINCAICFQQYVNCSAAADQLALLQAFHPVDVTHPTFRFWEIACPDP